MAASLRLPLRASVRVTVSVKVCQGAREEFISVQAGGSRKPAWVSLNIPLGKMGKGRDSYLLCDG